MFRTECIIRYQGRTYFGAEGFGISDHGLMLCLVGNKEGDGRGTLFTAIPISPQEYRARLPTNAGYTRTARTMTVYDDWGNPYVFSTAKSVIDMLEQDFIEHDIPKRTETNG